MRVFAFGDSHAMKFRDFYEARWQIGLPLHAFCGGQLGLQPPQLSGLQRTGDKGRKVYADMMQEVGPEDVVLFVMGEPDCRLQFYCHHKRDGIPIADLMANTIERYRAFLATVEVGYAVLDVIPAIEQGNIYEFAYYATRAQRAGITRDFNALLERACAEDGVPLVRTYDVLADDNGFLLREYEEGPTRSHVTPAIVPHIHRQLCEYFPALEGKCS